MMLRAWIVDYGQQLWSTQDMEEIAISKFKATCLSVLERVHKTRKPVLVTRFGQPVAEVAPPSVPDRPANWLGSMTGTGRIVGDIVSPASDSEDWEALRR
jgi:antitoxin (DNA-binding transcriptional repressor) of toxin-antitoxin stability system